MARAGATLDGSRRAVARHRKENYLPVLPKTQGTETEGGDQSSSVGGTATRAVPPVRVWLPRSPWLVSLRRNHSRTGML